MEYDGKILSRAREILENNHNANVSEHNRRIRKVYLKVPEIGEIDAELAGQWKTLASLAFSKKEDSSEKIRQLKEYNLTLQMHRTEKLTENGFPPDYLDEIFTCSLCRDTGTTAHGMCSCLKKLYKNELSKELSPLLKTGDECFDHFDLSLYSGDYNSLYGCVPREYMKAVYTACKAFSDAFPNTKANLLFRGSAGLGKTYLSACIARAVSEKGYSVCYDSASSAFDYFERRRFSRDASEQDNAALRVSRMLDCDLMILDDLGTELVTPASMNALYTLINTRLNSGKRMIISTNLSPEEFETKYSEAISSRIAGEFLALQFCGDDIRRILKSRK